jgi:hypothetical protein
MLYFFRHPASLSLLNNNCIMSKEKKVIEVINKFPVNLSNIKMMLDPEHTDHILDASLYSQPVSLIAVANPDILLLNLNLPAGSAIEIVGEHMQDNLEMKTGMITNNSGAFYMSLCRTLSSEYFIEGLSLELVPGALSKKQLN